MITDDDAILLGPKIPWKTKSARTEYFRGELYGSEVTLQYKKTLSIQDDMRDLVVNKDEHPGFIKFIAHRPMQLADGDYLVKIFEPFTKTVETVTEELLPQGQSWAEEALMKMLVDIAGACELLARRNITHNRISPRHLLVTPHPSVKLPLVKAKARGNKQSIYSAPEANRPQARRDVGISDVYSLGATLAYMALGHLPREVELATRKWGEFAEEIATRYRVLGSVLPRMLEENCERRYNFRHLMLTVTEPVWTSLLLLNHWISEQTLPTNFTEAKEKLETIAKSPLGASIIGLQPIHGLFCPSCSRGVEDFGQAGFVCDCGSINLR